MAAPYVCSRLLVSDRRRSEDRAEVFERGDALIVVIADGAGGGRGGAVASEALVDRVRSVADDATRDLYDVAAWTEVLEEADGALGARDARGACYAARMRHPSLRVLLAAMLLGCGGAPRVSRSPSAPPSPEQHDAGEPDRAQAHGSIADGTAAIAATMRGSHRSRGAADRDQYRHPVETLAFLGFTPTMTVLDVGPGGRGLGLGYYTELLAPVLAKDGLYLATNREPPSTAPAPNTHHWTDYEGVRFDDLLRAAPDLYGKVEVVRVDNSAPKLNLDGKVDMVLLMREVHMMKNWGTLDTWLHEIHRALKPNGILGIEDHRAAPGTDPDKCAAMAYLPEAWVIAQVEAAGFTLVARSEINANPRDTRDHPKGAWTLPPELALGDVDRDKYLAIGESDRMTLKFVRATYAAAAVGWDLRDGVPRFGVEALAREVGRGSSTPRASAGTRGSQARRAAAGTRRCAAPVAGSPSPYGECAIG